MGLRFRGWWCFGCSWWWWCGTYYWTWTALQQQQQSMCHGLADAKVSSGPIYPTIPPSHPIRTAKNPTTGGTIQLKPVVWDDEDDDDVDDRKVKKKGYQGVWQRLLSEGGWMIHDGEMVPVFDKSRSPSPSSPRRMIGNEKSSSNSVVGSHRWFFLDPSFEPLLQPSDNELTRKDLILPPSIAIPRMEELLWIAKPAGLLTLPGKTEPDSLATRVNDFLGRRNEEEEEDGTVDARMSKSKSKNNNNNKNHRKKMMKNTKHEKPWIPRPCHRLDQDTSGIVVMATSKDAYAALSKQFEDRWVIKQYVALVHGSVGPTGTRGIIDVPIGKIWNEHGGFHVWSTSEHALRSRSAVTEYSVSRSYPASDDDDDDSDDDSDSEDYDTSYTRLILQPRTGRGHQLRLHLAECLGHGIVGDALHEGVIRSGKKNDDDDDDRQQQPQQRERRRRRRRRRRRPFPPTHWSSRLCLHAEYLEFWVRTKDDRIGKARCWFLPPF